MSKLRYLTDMEACDIDRQAEKMAVAVECAMKVCEKLELDMDEHLEAIYSLIFEAVKD